MVSIIPPPSSPAALLSSFFFLLLLVVSLFLSTWLEYTTACMIFHFHRVTTTSTVSYSQDKARSPAIFYTLTIDHLTRCIHFHFLSRFFVSSLRSSLYNTSMHWWNYQSIYLTSLLFSLLPPVERLKVMQVFFNWLTDWKQRERGETSNRYENSFVIRWPAWKLSLSLPLFLTWLAFSFQRVFLFPFSFSLAFFSDTFARLRKHFVSHRNKSDTRVPRIYWPPCVAPVGETFIMDPLHYSSVSRQSIHLTTIKDTILLSFYILLGLLLFIQIIPLSLPLPLVSSMGMNGTR